ncbi:MAG: hypothetical protein ACK55S_05680, partial [Planctomycetota bacterium]
MSRYHHGSRALAGAIGEPEHVFQAGSKPGSSARKLNRREWVPSFSYAAGTRFGGKGCSDPANRSQLTALSGLVMTISNKLRAGACGLYCFRVLLCVCLSLGIAGWSSAQDGNFNRIASFPTYWNNGERAKSETVAEIIAASDDGMTLIYTDSPLKAVGRIDLRDPRNPRPLGVTDVGGAPTSVTVSGSRGSVAVRRAACLPDPS